jgi:hypothetical protein
MPPPRTPPARPHTPAACAAAPPLAAPRGSAGRPARASIMAASWYFLTLRMILMATYSCSTRSQHSNTRPNVPGDGHSARDVARVRRARRGAKGDAQRKGTRGAQGVRAQAGGGVAAAARVGSGAVGCVRCAREAVRRGARGAAGRREPVLTGPGSAVLARRAGAARAFAHLGQDFVCARRRMCRVSRGPRGCGARAARGVPAGTAWPAEPSQAPGPPRRHAQRVWSKLSPSSYCRWPSCGRRARVSAAGRRGRGWARAWARRKPRRAQHVPCRPPAAAATAAAGAASAARGRAPTGQPAPRRAARGCRRAACAPAPAQGAPHRQRQRRSSSASRTQPRWRARRRRVRRARARLVLRLARALLRARAPRRRGACLLWLALHLRGGRAPRRAPRARCACAPPAAAARAPRWAADALRKLSRSMFENGGSRCGMTRPVRVAATALLAAPAAPLPLRHRHAIRAPRGRPARRSLHA